MNGFILCLHNVYHVPDLQYNLYSVKQHKNYYLCEYFFGYKGDILAFPHICFHIDDHNDLLIYATDAGPSTNKTHWSSTNGLHLKGAKSSLSHDQPCRLPSQKRNPSKNYHRHLATIDLHQYLGFRTLKNLTHFKTIFSQPTVTIIPAGSTPVALGDVFPALWLTTKHATHMYYRFVTARAPRLSKLLNNFD